MRFSHLTASLLLGASLAFVPRLGAAQTSVVQAVRPNRNTQFFYTNGVVVQRLGNQSTSLTQNVRLPNGTKINVRSGIVELPTGKITTLREGDYVNAEGGIVFGSPASAAAARGDTSVAANSKFDTYVHVGTAPTRILGDAPTEREQLLMRKIELLSRKVTLLTQTNPNPPSTEAVDKQLQEIDVQLKTAKRE
ncbi:MAG TPA: DUF6799 domain-containing protein [Hymenobacter sp.]|uniref:DUF6799 domain-containing protein n=1 Tax=Hymenobacter sp. TaxID=1898978 RepID=UPI002D80C7C6|nr:DUF6799 domain-containing protein [Hymenobacter sp.]HET9504457.1 DUF6799 domain-containing protein [Hymenobacter sp.]